MDVATPCQLSSLLMKRGNVLVFPGNNNGIGAFVDPFTACAAGYTHREARPTSSLNFV